MKNPITKIKSILKEINSRLQAAEKQINDMEDKIMENKLKRREKNN